MKQIKEEYIVEGYLVDRFGNKISKEFREQTQATSFEEAERNVVFRIKRKLGYVNNFPAYLKQVNGKHFTHRRARDV